MLLQSPVFVFAGDKKPTGTSYVNLASNTYNYNATYTVNVYTNTQFSGVTTMTVPVKIIVDKNGMRNESKGITVHLRRSDNSSIDVTSSISVSGGTAKFKNLDAKKKYYIQFTKQNDSQIYKISGKITK
jgi:hypothetical protein